MPESPITILQRQRALLQAEYAYEKAEFQRLTEATGIEQKVRRGVAWYPLTLGRSYHNSLNQLVVEVTRSESADTDSEREEPSLFEPGKPVCFFSEDASGDRYGTGGLLHYYQFVAQVSYIEEDCMVIALPSPDALEQIRDAYRLGVQLYLDEQTYRLMFEALDEVITAKTGRLADLREMFHSTLPCGKFSFAPVRFPWLNTSQQAAVNEVLWAKDVAVVHGPPGTGKTTTLVEAIYETLRRENQVLVCAQSNMAVDWIAEKLVDRGVSVLRMWSAEAPGLDMKDIATLQFAFICLKGKGEGREVGGILYGSRNLYPGAVFKGVAEGDVAGDHYLQFVCKSRFAQCGFRTYPEY